MFSPLNLETGGDGRHPMTLYDQQQIVLAGMICGGPKALADGMEVLTTDDFTTEHTKRMFETIRLLYVNGDPVSPISVGPQISEDDRTWYLSLVEEWFLTDEIGYFVRLLKTSSQLNRINRAAYELAYCESMDNAVRLVSKINELTSARRDMEIVSLAQAVQEYVDSIDQKPEFIRTGLRVFDDEVKLERGYYCVIGGLASSGKTLLALQLAQIIGLKYRVGFFSTETGRNRISTRTIASRSGIGNKKIIEKNLSKAEVEQVKKVAKLVSRVNMDIIPASNMTAGDIRAITLSRKFDVIFVDYLQNIQSSNPRATGYERATEVTRTFQALSRTGKVLVFALSQLSRPEVRKDGNLVPPSMASLRESGQIEQDADVIALLYRQGVDDNNSNRIMKVVKNRDGELFDLLLGFSGATQRLEVIDRLHNGQPSTVPSDEEPPAEWKEAPRAF